MKNILPLLAVLALPLSPAARSYVTPDPIKVAPNGHVLPQPDPANVALALTAEPKTPLPPRIEWWGWMAIPAGVQEQTGIVFGTGGGQPLHAEMAWPKNPPQGLMPAIIWIHGGPGILYNQTFAQNPALSSSPIVQIGASEPPFLVVQGDKDPTGLFTDSVDFVAAMLKAGARVEFITDHNAGHGVSTVAGLPSPELSVHQVLGRMAEFFDKYLKSQPPTAP